MKLSPKAFILFLPIFAVGNGLVSAIERQDVPRSWSSMAGGVSSSFETESGSASVAGRDLGNKTKKEKKEKKQKKKEKKLKKQQQEELYEAEDEYSGDSEEAYGYDNEEEMQDDYNYYDEEEEEETPEEKRGRVPNDYELLQDGSEVLDRLLALKRRFPDFVSLHNAQDEFGLPPSGGAEDCEYEHYGAKNLATRYTHGCRHWYLVIEDKKAHPEGSESWKRLPEVFWSGALHGDERVGPTAVVEAAELLVEAAACEQLPRNFGPDSRGNHGNNHSMWHADISGREFCESVLADSFGLSDRHRRWLGRLVSTRRVVVMPTPNALGFHRGEREEDDVDPNHDFGYDRAEHPSHCMRSIAARSINEVFRQHMFQLALSFHSGDECIGYVWGTTQYTDAPSPDEVALYRIAGAYSDFGGKFKDTHHYKLLWNNERNQGGVHGGFEDWSYAGSWDSQNVQVCTPDEDLYGAYGSLKTIYNDATLRALTLYIGTSEDREPPADTLGNDADIFAPVGEGSGNIPRNVRVSLLSLELVQPYVEILAVGGLVRRRDALGGVLPGVPRWDRTSCTQTHVVSLSTAASQVFTVEFSVGGALKVEDTRVVYAKWTDVPAEIGCSSHPQTLDGWGPHAQMGVAMGDTFGYTQWSNDEGDASPRDGSDAVLEHEDGPVFASQIDLQDFQAGDVIAVWAMAKVDNHWKDLTSTGEVHPHDRQPQSHVVNARTNPSWFYESAGKVVEGREYFSSIPLTLVLRNDGPVDPQPMANRFEGTERVTGLNVESTVPSSKKTKSRSWGTSSNHADNTNKSDSDNDKEPLWMRDEVKYLGAFFLASCVLYCAIRYSCCCCCCGDRRRGRSVVPKDEEEMSLSPLKHAAGQEDTDDDDDDFEIAYSDEPPQKNAQDEDLLQ